MYWNKNTNKLEILNNFYKKHFNPEKDISNIYLNMKKNALYIQQGQDNAPHKLYAIIDPSCKYCNNLFKATQNLIQSGFLSVRWIPVGALNNSKHIVENFFNSENPLESLVSYYNNKKYNKFIKDDKKTENNIFITKYIKRFPTVIYKTNEGYLRIYEGDDLPINKNLDNQNNIAKIKKMLVVASNEF